MDNIHNFPPARAGAGRRRARRPRRLPRVPSAPFPPKKSHSARPRGASCTMCTLKRMASERRTNPCQTNTRERRTNPCQTNTRPRVRGPSYSRVELRRPRGAGRLRSTPGRGTTTPPDRHPASARTQLSPATPAQPATRPGQDCPDPGPPSPYRPADRPPVAHRSCANDRRRRSPCPPVGPTRRALGRLVFHKLPLSKTRNRGKTDTVAAGVAGPGQDRQPDGRTPTRAGIARPGVETGGARVAEEVDGPRTPGAPPCRNCRPPA